MRQSHNVSVRINMIDWVRSDSVVRSIYPTDERDGYYLFTADVSPLIFNNDRLYDKCEFQLSSPNIINSVWLVIGHYIEYSYPVDYSIALTHSETA